MRPDLGRELEQGWRRLGLVPDERTVQHLLHYLDLLQRWGKTYNLTAVREPHQMLGLHILDCAALLPVLDRFAPPRPYRLLDVGSGAGLPGAVVAISAPDIQVTCIDAVAKKASFIRQVAAELGLQNLQAVHARVEDLQTSFEAVTARAFASLKDLTALTAHCLAPAGAWYAMKAKRPEDEMAALPSTITVFHVEQVAVPGLEADRCVICMRPTAGN